jgi:hypothetical protein
MDQIDDQKMNDQQSQKVHDGLYHCYELELNLEVEGVEVEEEEDHSD